MSPVSSSRTPCPEHHVRLQKERRAKVTAQPHDFLSGGTPGPAKSLRAIRAALVVRQDREAFDAGLKAVLDEVRVNLDLGVLNDFVQASLAFLSVAQSQACSRRRP
jgi:hypothetical protein